MPERLIHCQCCRALLNPDLKSDSVEIPPYIPLQEISSMIEVHPRGFFFDCPNCSKELRVNRKYLNQKVSCKFCKEAFDLSLKAPALATSYAIYAACPHCKEDVRANKKYLNEKVACKHCSGKIHLMPVDG